MARTLHPHCQGPGFDPWSGNYDPANLSVQPKKKKLTLSHLVNYNSFFPVNELLLLTMFCV